MSKKNAMIQKAEARLDQVNAEIDRLKAKADEVEADTRLEAKRELDELKSKRDEFAAKASELRDATESALTDVANGFERAWASLSDSVKRAAERYG